MIIAITNIFLDNWGIITPTDRCFSSRRRNYPFYLRAWKGKGDASHYNNYATCNPAPTEGTQTQWIAEQAARAALTPDTELLQAFLFELGLSCCTFVPKEANIPDYDHEQNPLFAQANGGAPWDLRGRLEELIVEYDNQSGDVSFGLRRHVPKGFPPQRQFFFPRIFRGINRFTGPDARFFLAISTVPGRTFR